MNICGVVEAFASVAQVLDEFPVGVDLGEEMAELAEQGASASAKRGLNSRIFVSSRSSKNSERFLDRSATGTSGSNSRRCSATSRDTNVQPMSSAQKYTRGEAWTLLVIVGGANDPIFAQY